MDRVASLLKDYGPMLSGDLARLYERTYKVSNEAARKAVSRYKPPVKKLYKIRFEKNQYFFYLEKQYKSERYVNALLKAIAERAQGINTYMQAFLSQNGYVSKSILPALVSAPVGNVKGHKRHEDILQGLIDSGIILEYTEEIYMLASEFFDGNLHRAKALETVKNVIIRDFNCWARNINLVSYEAGKGLFESAEFAQFQWAYTAPSYIQPLFSGKDKKPGFVIADVYFGRTATKESVQFFIDKLNIIRSYKKLCSIFPVFLVDKIDKEALEYLKENKVTIAILNNIFSAKYTELLSDLVNVFTNATAILNKDPEKVYKLFDELSKSEGRYNNMAGDMFELLVASHFVHVGYQNMRLQELIIDEDTGKRKELDIRLYKDGAWKVIECKAMKSQLGADFVVHWLNDNIPVARKWIKLNMGDDNMEFELWSVSGFTEDALALLKKAETETKRYAIRYFDGTQMVENAKKVNDQHFVDIMKQHFQA